MARDAEARAAWGDAAALAGVELDAARTLLAGTEGQVADDTERQALTVEIAGTQAALDAGSDPPGQGEIAAVTAATAALHDAAATSHHGARGVVGGPGRRERAADHPRGAGHGHAGPGQDHRRGPGLQRT